MGASHFDRPLTLLAKQQKGELFQRMTKTTAAQAKLGKRRNTRLIGCCWLVFAASSGLVAIDATTPPGLRSMRRSLESTSPSSSSSSEEQKATTTPQQQQQPHQAVVVPQPLVTKEMQQQQGKSQEQQQHNVSKNDTGTDEVKTQEQKDKELNLAREEEKMMQAKRLIIGIVIGLLAMIFTAWQMSDYPDGFYAALCRCIIRAIGGFLRILSSPFRACLGFSSAARYAGHMPVATMDYGYKDPSLQTS